MKFKLELEDVVTLTTRNGEKTGGTIIGIDEMGYILKTGPEDNDIEVIERTRIQFMDTELLVRDTELPVRSDANGRPIVIHATPALGSMPPRYNGIIMKWYHSPDGACTCGCTGGGDSESPNYLTS